MVIVFHLLTDNPDREANARRTIKTAERLAEFGHDVYVFSNLPDFENNVKRKNWLFTFKNKFVKNGVKHQQYFCVPFCFGGIIRRLFHYYSFAFSSRFARLPKGVKPDFVVATEPPLFACKSAAHIAKKYKAKLIFDIQDIWPQVGVEIGAIKDQSLKFKMMQQLSNYMYKHSDAIVTVSRRKVEHLNQLMKKFNKKAVFIPNATDKSFISSGFDKEFLDKYSFDKFFSVVHVGKVGKAQDLDSFLEIAKHHLDNNDIRFFLLGDGVEMARILNRIKNENIQNVIYCGTCSQLECYTALANAKLSYVSLVNNNLQDSVPTKIFESLYCGCPVLLSASGESTDVVKESQYGLCSEPGNLKKLLENFEYIYNNYAKLEENKNTCIDFIERNYERESVTRIFEQLLFNLNKD